MTVNYQNYYHKKYKENEGKRIQIKLLFWFLLYLASNKIVYYGLSYIFNKK